MRPPHMCIVDRDGLYWCPRHEGPPPPPFGNIVAAAQNDPHFRPICGRCEEEIQRNFKRILDRLVDSTGFARDFNPDDAGRGTHCALVLSSSISFEPAELVTVDRNEKGFIRGGTAMRASDGDVVDFNVVNDRGGIRYFALTAHLGVVIIGEHVVPG